ncbi:MAG: hypothetical protein HQ476_05540 [SAR202 cluster bacterium]|nr:hypothetical protein [SAR202 cluster bacterium]
MRKITDLNFEDLKEVALKRATSKTYFAILLIILSLVAAVAITGKANRSVEMWSPKTNLVEGDLLSQENLEIVRVFLPDNLHIYLRASQKIGEMVAVRKIYAGELIPTTSAANYFQGTSSKGVPLEISRNDLPNDLLPGQRVDIYSLPTENLNSAKTQPTELVLTELSVESIDSKSREMGGAIGIVLKIPEPDVLKLLACLNSSRIVVVRSAL